MLSSIFFLLSLLWCLKNRARLDDKTKCFFTRNSRLVNKTWKCSCFSSFRRWYTLDEWGRFCVSNRLGRILHNQESLWKFYHNSLSSRKRLLKWHEVNWEDCLIQITSTAVLLFMIYIRSIAPEITSQHLLLREMNTISDLHRANYNIFTVDCLFNYDVFETIYYMLHDNLTKIVHVAWKHRDQCSSACAGEHLPFINDSLHCKTKHFWLLILIIASKTTSSWRRRRETLR